MPIFSPEVGEKDVTRAIMKHFSEEFMKLADTDVIIIGGGPSGLMAGRDLCRKGVDVLIIEQNNYLGGGFWIGGYLMNPATFRHPSEAVLDELGIKYTETDTKNLFVAPAPYACSKLISSACEAGVKILNMTQLDDLVIREGNRIGGVVVNWTPVNALPRNVTCVDPIALESKLVLDASGHDAVAIRRLEERGILKVPGMAGMWVERAEDAIVEHTGEAYPGLIVSGMAVAEVYGLPRMGPTFGGMLLSGKKAAEVILEKLKEAPAISVR